MTLVDSSIYRRSLVGQLVELSNCSLSDVLQWFELMPTWYISDAHGEDKEEEGNIS